MSGNTSNATAVRSFIKFFQEWSLTIFGIVLLGATVGISASMICNTSGYCRQPNLNASDIQKLSLVSREPVLGAKTQTTPTAITKPVRMLLPSVNIGLDTIDATINIITNDWPLSDNAARYANFSPGLGSEKGTLLIYGHGTLAVLEKTVNLQIGDKLVLIDDRNKTWQFTYTKKELVAPENVGFIYEDTPFRVVVFTCEGWNNQYRRLMFFSPAY